MNRGDLTRAIDHKSSRQRGNATVKVGDHLIANHDAICDLALLNVWLHNAPSFFVHRYAEYSEALVLILFVELLEPGNFGTARYAPCCPEVEQYHFVLVIGQSGGRAGRVFQFELRGGLPLCQRFNIDLKRLFHNFGPTARQKYKSGNGARK